MGVSNATSGFGTILKSGDGGTQSQYITDSANSGILWQARDAGVAGDSITIAIQVSGVAVVTTVSVVGTAITVTSKSSDGIAFESTAQEVIDAIRAEEDADALVIVSNIGNGTGVVTEQTTQALGGGVDEVFTAVAEVTSLQGPGLALDTIETTHFESPGAFREYIPSLKDPGSLSIEMNFLPASVLQNAFLTDYLNRTRRNFQVVWSDSESTTWQFGGYVVSFEPSAAIDDKLSASAEIKVTGQPNFAAG